MGSPSEYISNLELELRSTRQRLNGVERELNEYAERLQELVDKYCTAQAAARSAAESTITAIDRILELQVIVDAAIEWRESIKADPHVHLRCATDLKNKVDEFQKRVRARS